MESMVIDLYHPLVDSSCLGLNNNYFGYLCQKNINSITY